MAATTNVTNSSNQISDTSGNTVQIQTAATTASYVVKMPPAQGGASTTLINDGVGNLSWGAGGGGGSIPAPLEAVVNLNQTIVGPTSFVGNVSDTDQTNLCVLYGSTDTSVIGNSTSAVFINSGVVLATSGGGGSGNINISTGFIASANNGSAGQINIKGGDAGLGNGGQVTITGGNSNSNSPGGVSLSAGSSNGSVNGASVNITAGSNSSTGNGGFINLIPGSGVIPGQVVLFGLMSTSTLGVVFNGTGGSAVTIAASSSGTTAYSLALPTAQGTGALTNDGSGNLSWTTSSITSTSQTVNNGDTLISNVDYNMISSGAGGTIYANNTVGTGSFIQANITGQLLGQTFTPTLTGSINTVTLTLLVSSGSVSGNLVCHIYNTSGGAPQTVIATSAPYDTAGLTNSFQPIVFTFSPTVALVSGTVYGAILDFSGVTFAGGNSVVYESDNGNPYAGGSAYGYSSGWSNFTGIYDVVFEVDGITSVVSTSSSTAITAGTTVGQQLTLQNVGAGPIEIINGAATQLSRMSSILVNSSDTVELVWDGAHWTQLSDSPNGTNPPPSIIRLNTPNGHGSTNTTVRRWSVLETNDGNSDITYADDAALGMLITINTTGLYAITYTDDITVGSPTIGMSRNAAGSDLSTNIITITTANRLMAIQGTTNSLDGCTIVSYLLAGDLIRSQDAGTNDDVGPYSIFQIIKIS